MKWKDCNVVSCVYRTSDAEKECEFQSHVIQVPDEWQGVRIQAAIAAMQGMLANNGLYLKEGDTFPNLAVRYADALIEELKRNSYGNN